MSSPPATGVRVEYAAAPAELHAWVDETLCSPVIEATTQPGGFSPGVAARLLCTDGSRAFCKAVSAEVNDFAASAHRHEQRISGSLPAAAPVPRLLAKYDDGTWVALLLQDINGRQPTLPWRPDELARVITAIDALAVALTPTPIDAPLLGDAEDKDFWGWRGLAAGSVDGSSLPKWAGVHLDRLAALEPSWLSACAGDTLLHCDLRADNLLLSEDQVWVVDWPWACLGKPWVDVANLAPSVAMQGGPPPAEVFAMSAASRGADRDEVAAYVCALAGYFVSHSLRPAAVGLPTVRAFQAAQGTVALGWLAQLTGW
jgi:aminoglycoside phosphotransferase (APT) family kinase protein